MTDAVNKAFSAIVGWSIRTSGCADSLACRKRQPLLVIPDVGGSLIVGGVGVANAVRAFLDFKLTTIASLKFLGVPASVVTMA